MTKKAIVLSIILAILIISITIIIFKQNNGIIKDVTLPEEKQEVKSFDYIVENDEDFSLSKLKSYNLPILIQLRL